MTTTITDRLEAARPQLEGTPAAILNEILIAHLRINHSALIACTNVQLGLIARALETESEWHEGNYSLTLTEGDTSVIIQTAIQTQER